jgi:hypothetical protein
MMRYATIDPDALYWCVIEQPRATRVRRRWRASDVDMNAVAIEHEMPVPLGELHVTGARVGDHLVVCAIERATLAGWLAAGNGTPGNGEWGSRATATSDEILTLTPAALPKAVRDALASGRSPEGGARDVGEVEGDTGEGAAGALNLLHGAFTPRTLVERERRRRSIALWALIAGLAVASAWLHMGAAAARDGRARVLSTVLQRDARSDGQLHEGTADVHARAARARAALADARAAALPGVSPPTDASALMGYVLSRWPTVSARVERVRVEQAEVSIVATVPTAADLERLVAAIVAPPGWRTTSPRVSPSGSSLRVVILLRADAATPGERP